jgi:hypothetical protein
MPRSSQGTKLQLEISSVFTDIAFIVGVDGPNPEGEFFDSTHLQSADNARTFLPTVWQVGDVTSELLYTPLENTHRKLFELLKSQTLSNWKVIYPDGSTGTTHAFAAYVKGVGHAAQTAEGLKGTLTLQVTGTMTPPASS